MIVHLLYTLQVRIKSRIYNNTHTLLHGKHNYERKCVPRNTLSFRRRYFYERLTIYLLHWTFHFFFAVDSNISAPPSSVCLLLTFFVDVLHLPLQAETSQRYKLKFVDASKLNDSQTIKLNPLHVIGGLWVRVAGLTCVLMPLWKPTGRTLTTARSLGHMCYAIFTQFLSKLLFHNFVVFF